MSSNPFINYYVNQAGTGIGGFQGVRFQRGQGFFGNVYRNAILPLLKYFGKKALNTGMEVAGDAIDGENVLESLKTRGKRTVQDIASDAGERAKRFAQTGTGRKRRRRRNRRIKRAKNKTSAIPAKKRAKSTSKKKHRKKKKNNNKKIVSSIFG